jgi:putative nucleotidyltransferase with HDIG domain
LDEVKQARLEKYLEGVEDLPTLPYIVVQLLDKMHQPDPQIEELADLVMTDQVLTAQMINLVNSAFWGLTRKITSVRETIIYLGLRQVENLIYSVSLTNTFEQDAPLLKRVRFWEHSFGVALCSRLIAQRAGYRDEETVYLAGLLHDIGETLIALHMHHEFEKVVEQVLDENTTFYRAEEEQLGINHTDFGSWLVDRWKLPGKLANAISYHHNSQDAGEDQILVAMVRLADLICLYHQLDFGITEGENLTSEIVSIWKFLAQHSSKMAKLDMKLFLEEFNEQISIVKEMVSRVYNIDVEEAA